MVVVAALTRPNLVSRPMRLVGTPHPSPPIVAANVVLLALGLLVGCYVESPVPAAPISALPAPVDSAVAAQEALPPPSPPPGTRNESQPGSFCVTGAGQPNRRVTATIDFG